MYDRDGDICRLWEQYKTLYMRRFGTEKSNEKKYTLVPVVKMRYIFTL